jgi:hypothetical protein
MQVEEQVVQRMVLLGRKLCQVVQVVAAMVQFQVVQGVQGVQILEEEAVQMLMVVQA